MRTVTRAGLLAVLVLGAGQWSSAWVQKAQTTCYDVPIRWFIYPLAGDAAGEPVPAAIRGDGDWYSNSNGATNSGIHVCGTTPTYDATVKVKRRRKVAFSIPGPVTGSVIEQSLAAGTYQTAPFMNVRNLLCVGCADPSAPFTSHMSIRLYAVNGADYRLRFMPPVVDAPDRHINPEAIPGENTPYESSSVLVIPQAYDCARGGMTNPSWLVRGLNSSADPAIPATESLQVGTLRRFTRDGTVHAGQYSMPFELRIEALTCFSY